MRLVIQVTVKPPSIISTNHVTNANGSNYSLCFVSDRVLHHEPNRIQLDVWVRLGFSSAICNSSIFFLWLSAEQQEFLLPMPFGPQTPALTQLVLPNYSNSMAS